LVIFASILLTLVAGRETAFAPIEIKEGFAIGGVMAGGRTPVGFDSVQDAVVHGKWTMPKEGDTSPTSSGGTAKWRHVTAGKDGAFSGLGTYFAASVDVPNECAMVLEAAGYNMVYVNGAPRAGDPYGYGYLKLPVWLHKGQNSFLFSVGRGQLKAKLTLPRGPIQIETGDLTLPDVLIDGPKELWAGVVLLNTTEKAQRAHVFARNSAGSAAMVTAEIPAMSLRKVPVKLIVPDGDLGKEEKFQIECTQTRVTDKATFALEVRKLNETHCETFFSNIDGSLQYFAVNPAQKPSDKNPLILSLHGAGVEAIGQARAYSNKDWCTLVAATNRRPYGFDWEDIGRLDALEVLDEAKKRFPHDPESIHLTGHSMGGHGTWAVGTLYPDLFASIAPSAGWISFWSYAGGYRPRNATPVEAELLQAMSPSDTLARVENTLEEKVYILHGDKDDNVPVAQAREMKRVLTSIHAAFEYHDEPGAGHWWGDQCVDWPPIFDQIRTSRLTPRKAIDFTTPSPAVSSHDEWVTILEQTHAMAPSQVKIGETEGTTKNVHALQLNKSFESLTLDGQKLRSIHRGTQLIDNNGQWHVDRLKDGAKSPENSGPFKNVYQNRFVFVVATHGTAEENAWAAEKARYDAETFQYRGNGAVDIVADSQYNVGWQRNVVLYGNSETNSAWKPLLATCPIQVTRGQIKVGDKVLTGGDLASLFVYPHKAHGKWVLVGAISGTGLEGLRTTDRLSIFASGVAYPDWTVFGADTLRLGSSGIRGCGFFGNDWSLAKGEAAWNP